MNGGNDVAKDFITVQELLGLVDIDVLVCKTIERDDFLSEHDREKITKSWQSFLSKMVDYPNVKSDDIVVFSRVWDSWGDGQEEYIDACVYKRDELLKYCTTTTNHSFHSLDTLKTFSTDEIKQYIHEINEGCPEGYAFEFSPWSEILGCKVSMGNVKRIGLQDCIYAVLHEMTFNGMTEESQNERRQELEASIKEAEEIDKLPLEERQKYYHDVEEVWKELGLPEDTRSEEEKEEQDRKIVLYYALTTNAVISELWSVSEEIGRLCV